MKRLALVLILVLGTTASLLFMGCEAESSADTELELTPRSVTLGYLGTAKFKVSGGFQYRWSLSDEQLGQLSNRSGDEVVYVNMSHTNSVQTLTVRSFIIGASGTSTNGVVTNELQSVTSASAIIISQP